MTVLRFAISLALLAYVLFSPAQAADFADVGVTAPRIDLRPYFELVETDKRDIAVEVQGGAKPNLMLSAKGAGPQFRWLVVNFSNSAAGAREVVIEFPDQGFAGSGLLWPKSAARHIASVAMSGAVAPQSLPATGATAFVLNLVPGATTTMAFEISTPYLPAAAMWQRAGFDLHGDRLSLFYGALLGIAGIFTIGIFALFGFRRRQVILCGGGLALASTVFLLLETGHLSAWVAGFDSRFFTVAVARAFAEGLMTAFLILYLESVADLRRHIPVLSDMLLLAGGLAFAIPVYGLVEPLVASGLARIAFGAVAAFGLGLILVLWQRGLIGAGPALVTWAPMVIWVLIGIAAMFANPERFQLSPIFLAGLCASIVVMGAALAQLSFSDGVISPQDSEDAIRRVQALAGARTFVWIWQSETAELHVGEDIWLELGFEPDEMVDVDGMVFLESIHPSDRSAYLVALKSVEEEGCDALECEFRLADAEESYQWFQLRASLVAGDDDGVTTYAGTLTDITATKQSLERMLDGSVHDFVTGLPNRALFVDRLARAMNSSERADNVNIYVLVIEIDRFRAINDVSGHVAGDNFLGVTARRLVAAAGPGDSVARLPGGQFAVLFSSKVGERDIVGFSAELRRALTQSISVDGQDIYLTVSIGVAHLRETGISGGQLLKDALLALYEAKRRGNDMIEVFQPAMRDDHAELVILEAELRRAIERDEIEVHYQPIAHLADMNLAGFEALVRWRHPKLGLLAPDSFIGLAEQTGMIKDIGRKVFNEAGRQLGIWQRSFRLGQPFFISVNIASAQLIGTDLVEEIDRVVEREGLVKDSFKIEVTESVIMQNPELSAQILQRLRDLGIGLACDDFGTGYSSLSSLRKMPFDTLKVDRSFVAADAQGGKAQTILEGIVALAHALNLKIVAEGVETQAQVDRLGEMNCDMGQGSFICRPMTARQVGDALTGMPYDTTGERTAITWLWEKAAKDRDQAPTLHKLSAASIVKSRPRAETPEPARPEREQSLMNLANELLAKEIAPEKPSRQQLEALETESPSPRAAAPKKRKKKTASEQPKPH